MLQLLLLWLFGVWTELSEASAAVDVFEIDDFALIIFHIFKSYVECENWKKKKSKVRKDDELRNFETKIPEIVTESSALNPTKNFQSTNIDSLNFEFSISICLK